MNDLNRKYTVLFVDDEPRITSALRAIFRREYNVLIANSGADALVILEKHNVDVLVSDQRMPEMLGNDDYPSFERERTSNNDSTKANNNKMATSADEPIDKDRAMLMIEQQKDIRHQIRKFCSKESIMIYSTQNVEQAIAAATTRKSIGVAIVELSEDTDEAVQIINLLKQARPELITIALTEDYDADTAVDLINQGQVFKYLAKPLDITGFQETIQNAFMRHRFLKKNKNSTKRFKVEKTSSILSDLQGLFARFVH